MLDVRGHWLQRQGPPTMLGNAWKTHDVCAAGGGSEHHYKKTVVT